MSEERTTKIRRKDGEYRVRLYIDGHGYEPADYFTPDKDDAEATAKMMVEKP